MHKQLIHVSKRVVQNIGTNGGASRSIRNHMHVFPLVHNKRKKDELYTTTAWDLYYPLEFESSLARPSLQWRNLSPIRICPDPNKKGAYTSATYSKVLADDKEGKRLESIYVCISPLICYMGLDGVTRFHRCGLSTEHYLSACGRVRMWLVYIVMEVSAESLTGRRPDGARIEGEKCDSVHTCHTQTQIHTQSVNPTHSIQP